VSKPNWKQRLVILMAAALPAAVVAGCSTAAEDGPVGARHETVRPSRDVVADSVGVRDFGGGGGYTTQSDSGPPEKGGGGVGSGGN